MVTAFCIIALIAAGVYFSCSVKDTPVPDIILYSFTGYFFTYVFSTAVLLLPNFYSVKKAAFLCMIFWLGMASVSLIRGRRPSCSFNIKPFIIPIAAAVIGAALVSAVPFDYFGMGQDQGVFQTEAILYTRGITGKQYDIKEYHIAETESEKEQVLSALTEPNLLGTKYYDETNIFLLLTGRSAFSLNETSQVFHGLHTFSSLLALGASIFGISKMVRVVTILFVMTIFWMAKIMEHLRISSRIQAVIMAVYILSPQVIWCAKSTLTETGLTMIWMVLIWLLLQKNSRAYMTSAAVITVFGLYHVSLYICMPLIVLIFFGIWLTSGERAALKAGILSVTGFLFSFVVDVLNNTDYTLKSYAPLFKGPINIGNIFYIVIAGCIVVIAAGLILLKAVKKPSLRISSKVLTWAVRILLLLAPLYPAYRLIAGKTGIDEFFRLTFPCIALLTGIAIPLILFADMTIFPSKWTDRHEHSVLLGLFLYCVVFFSIVMIPQVQYCYYYSRYLCMYIPMILLAGAVTLTRIKKSAIIAAAALILSIAVLLPYSLLLIRDKDDSRTQWENLSQIEQTLQQQGAEAVFMSPSMFHYYYYDLKSLGIDVYPIFDDFDRESADIAAKYVRIYVLDDGNYTDMLEDRYELICRVSNLSSMDWEQHLARPFLLPDEFTKECTVYSVYLFDH